MNSYKNKWKDPKWQKKRLEILERDLFACQHCADEDKTLHVHHAYYNFDSYKNPWDYSNDVLITLCETCHDEEHLLWKNNHSYLYNLHECDFPDGAHYASCAEFGLTIKMCQDMDISDHSIEVLKELYSYRNDYLPDTKLIPPLNLDVYGRWVKAMHFDNYALSESI